jgi:hypothetical protein
MNEDTRIVVFCYDGDRDLVEQHLPVHLSHRCPVAIMSPFDSPVFIQSPGVDCRNAGKRAYIGQDSINRHRAHLEMCLEYSENYFLLHDADSLCLSPEIPGQLYRGADDGIVWANEVVEFRPHQTPYPKIAMQPPYFLTRKTLLKLLAAPIVPTHPITPYLDWFWTANCWSAGVDHAPFSAIMHPSKAAPFVTGTPWEILSYSIRHSGNVMMHPIKTREQFDIVCRAYAERDDQ